VRSPPATAGGTAHFVSRLRTRRYAGGHAAAQALREVLAARAAQELRQSRADAATSDNPATPAVDEHAVTGLPRNARHVGDANRTAAQLAAEWYPDGRTSPALCPLTWLTGRRPTPRRCPRPARGPR
jgi:hypothetical protein